VWVIGSRLVLARIIEPTSKLDALRVLAVDGRRRGAVVRTAQAPPARYGKPLWCKEIAAARAILGPASLVLYGWPYGQGTIGTVC
jgi:hypothetical protein